MKTRRVLLAGAVALVAVRIRQRGWRLVEHDLVDHPLMTLWPKVGDWLHDRDELLEDEGGDSLLLFGDEQCVVCGCTDSRACPGGCWWAQHDPPVCSTCAAKATVIPAAGRPKCAAAPHDDCAEDLADLFEPDTWGHDFFDVPVADWVRELGSGQRTAMELTLLEKMDDPVLRGRIVDRQSRRGVVYGRTFR